MHCRPCVGAAAAGCATLLARKAAGGQLAPLVDADALSLMQAFRSDVPVQSLQVHERLASLQMWLNALQVSLCEFKNWHTHTHTLL